MNNQIQKKDDCGIFESVKFLNEGGSFAAKKNIVESDDYKKLKELMTEFKKNKKNREVGEKLRDEALEVLDRVIEEAKKIPSDNFFEWIGRLIIRQFDSTYRIILNLFFNTVTFKLTNDMTKEDFLDKLYAMKNKLKNY